MVLQLIEKPFKKSNVVARSYPSLKLLQETQKLSTRPVIRVNHNSMLQSSVTFKAAGPSVHACPREHAADLLNKAYVLEPAKLPLRSVKV